MTPVGKIGIPEARRRLKAVAWQLENSLISRLEAAETIRKLLFELVRNPPLRKAPKQSKPVDSKKAAKIRADLKRNPETPMQKIAEMHGTNAGRASEALHNLR